MVPNDNQLALGNWLQSRSDKWVALNRLIQTIRGEKDEQPSRVRELLHGFRGLAKDLSMARQALGDSKLTRQLEALFTHAHEVVYHKAHNPWHDLIKTYRYDIPHLVTRKMTRVIVVTISLFVLSGIAGWALVYSNPELASLIASEKMINKVQHGKLWTDDLLNIVPSSVLSVSIMTNNIMVSIFAFVLGAFYGVGTLYIISLNGIMLGGVFAFTAHYGMADRLFKFVIAHGVVELSIICIAGAAGVQLGEALIRPGEQRRANAFRDAVSEAGKLLFVAVPFLIGAGLIEGYISPNDSYPLGSRVVIGLCYGLLLWGVLSGKIWNRWQPLKTGSPSR